ncbi:hypothetical protein [Sphingomonas sp. Leaf62]|uniref:hypothetical protein n=1 Tax=Sphingomonas sp. Leaf62 TaxID=1736228 RepID=UPI0006F3517E|nr:hypothetical protein [Sphingomonas sp. Leaf62]KQN72099.1 hypothetical protein ASE91_05425 [Sphingomonas sp. Leaf62]
MPFEVIASAAANMIVFSAILYGLLSPQPEARVKLWSVVGLPATFNVLVALGKDDLTLDERFTGVIVTALACGIFAWLVWTKRLPNGQRAQIRP